MDIADEYSVGPLASRVSGGVIAPLIDKLTALTDSTTIDVSVPNTALRTLVGSLPHTHSAAANPQDVQTAYSAISRVLIPRLVGRIVLPQTKPASKVPPALLKQHADKGYSTDAVEVLIEVVKCYGNKLQDPELEALTQSVMAIVESPQAGGVVKKRSLAAVGALLPHFGDGQLSAFVSQMIESFCSPHLTPSHRRYLIATVGTIAKSTPHKFGPYLKTLAPFVLSAISQKEMDEETEGTDDDNELDPEVEELRETVLVSLEALLASCTSEMVPYMPEAVESALRYLKYDPNVAESDDEAMGGTQGQSSDDGVTEAEDEDDDEFAELDDDDAFSDVDDVSWKVRRCAAKVLYTVVNASTIADHAILFGRIAPVLNSRLNTEREENVKLEIIAAMAALVRKSGTTAFVQPSYSNGINGVTSAIPPVNKRKRRRQDSNASLQEFEVAYSPPVQAATPPAGGPQADLIALIPKTIQALNKMWKRASISLKQAAVNLLKALTLTRNGALADFLQQIEDPIADALKPGSGSSSLTSTSSTSATAASLQIETLSLISSITETNPSGVLLPFVIALIPGVTTTVRNKNYKVSGEALGALEQFVKALTPPRLATSEPEHRVHLEKLYDEIVSRVTDNQADLEVRHRAICVFGVLLGRTSPTELLSKKARTNGLQILAERLRNETTRLSSARAVGTVAAAITAQNPPSDKWTREVALEMANQLRKSDRALRGSCLDALKNLALNPTTATQFDKPTMRQLEMLLLPLMNVSDLHLLTPTLVILSRIISADAKALVNDDLIAALCAVVQTSLAGSGLKAYLLVIKVIGEQRVGQPLMKALLAVGTAGDPLVLGKAIGTLVVYGGKDIGVTVNDFLKELQSSQDTKNLCLALAVLGEVGYRMGPQSPLQPDTFVKSLASEDDKVRNFAAISLGNAGASNIPVFLPLILQKFSASNASDYLYLHAVKEILQHPDSAAKDIAPFVQDLWQKLFAVCDSEDNRAVGAECIGRLTLIDPNAYVPELERHLGDSNAMIRGTVISAFRFTLASENSSYNELLPRIMVPLITTMLSDSDIGNRRLAVTTLNSAIHNKPQLIVNDLSSLLPIVLADSYIKPELIKVVPFGPFKINVDDGLDLRKSCYETLYALLDTPAALPHLSTSTVFDRLLDGIPDDHDVRTLCQLMLGRLTSIDADETRRRLPAMAEKFRIVLSQKAKENAVKQEIEKLNEANAGVARTTMELDRNFPSAATDGSGEMVPWKAYLEWVKKEFAGLVRSILDEGSA